MDTVPGNTHIRITGLETQSAAGGPRLPICRPSHLARSSGSALTATEPFRLLRDIIGRGSSKRGERCGVDEHEDIARLRKGDIGGLEALVREYQIRAVATAWLVTCDRALAEDVVQTAFLKVYERAYQFDMDRPFGPWFLRIVANDAAKAVSRRDRQISLEQDGFGGGATATTSEMGPEEAVEWAETREQIWRAIEGLTPAQRVAVVLRYYVELPESQVADRLGIPLGTAKRRLHDARTRLRQLLARLQPGGAYRIRPGSHSTDLDPTVGAGSPEEDTDERSDPRVRHTSQP